MKKKLVLPTVWKHTIGTLFDGLGGVSLKAWSYTYPSSLLRDCRIEIRDRNGRKLLHIILWVPR